MYIPAVSGKSIRTVKRTMRKIILQLKKSENAFKSISKGFDENNISSSLNYFFNVNMVFFSVGITFTVNPSNIVEVNEVVTLQCAVDSNPTPSVVVFFSYDFGKLLCSLEPYNGVCKNASSSCVTRYNGSCSNETLFSMQVNVPWTWNGISLSCKSFFSKSNTINLTVTGTCLGIFFLKLEISLVVKFLIHFVRF